MRDLAEVYTHYREVTAMLDLVPDMFPSEIAPDNLDKTFLEPTAIFVGSARQRTEHLQHTQLQCAHEECCHRDGAGRIPSGRGRPRRCVG